MRAISQARGALNALAALLPDTAERVKGATLNLFHSLSCALATSFSSRPGARVPADGTVVEGTAEVDESMITASPKRCRRGRCQSHCGNGCQRRKPSRPHHGNRGPDRSLRNHAARRHCAGFRLSHASSCRPCCRDPFLRGSRVWRDYFHLLVVSGDKEHALIRTATVLVIACPHALGLAIPLVSQSQLR